MDNNLVSVVKGNDFILDLYVSKYDKDQGKQVPYDVSEATDVVLRLIGNNGFVKVIRDAQPNGFKITANVDGRLRDGKYGVELLFKINNMDKRIYQANKIEILNCNCCVDAGAQTTQVIPTYDLSMYIGVDVEKINFGAVTYGNIDIDSVLSETSTNPVMNKVVTAALKEAGKISDVLVNDESVVKDKVAEIIMPTKVSDLDNDAGYLTEHQSLSDYAKKTDIPDTTNFATKDEIPTVPSFKTINGEEITGTGNIEIKSSGSDYTAGEGINITDNVISSAFFKRGTGENSIQIIDASTQASGLYSLSLGYKTVASGDYSHAEGAYTTASNYFSHTEGHSTTASGQFSHAEGHGTTASGDKSHAEGYNTRASGVSHAEGSSTTASGSISHAEGLNAIASGDYSHAEGSYTTASNKSEHASGQYNISHKASNSFGDAGNTLFSVGNGKNVSTRHNAFEIRQNGDIYIADSSNGAPYKLQDKLNDFATKSEINSMYYTKTEIDNMVGDINNILNEI